MTHLRNWCAAAIHAMLRATEVEGSQCGVPRPFIHLTLQATSHTHFYITLITEIDTPRPSLDDLGLDLGSLYRISEGSERTQQEPDIGLDLQQLLLVAHTGSAGEDRSPSRVRKCLCMRVCVPGSKTARACAVPFAMLTSPIQ